MPWKWLYQKIRAPGCLSYAVEMPEQLTDETTVEERRPFALSRIELSCITRIPNQFYTTDRNSVEVHVI
ncbi:hypothetical protein AAC387_Pa06g1076 [Persea americana]